jgi:2-polyprenyl-6-methoxyphenol hydroxylase-like FAD-dependent oxidoreductase
LNDDSDDDDAMKPPRQRVAIVGSGMAGLVAGYLLANDKEGRFDVEVLEMVRVPCSPFFFLLLLDYKSVRADETSKIA